MITGNYYDLYKVKKKYRVNEAFIEKILEQNYRYYRNLSPNGKNKFLARITDVLYKSEFVGHHGLEVTDEMRVCIIFAKIQLTYGLELYSFKNFKKFILYPESFYSRFFDQDLKGLTSSVGFVTFSWLDFQEGYLVHNDKFNLGLHEMAHALRLEIESFRNPNTIMQLHSDRMDDEAIEHMNMVARGVPTILRDYAFTNDEEFFAVCVEYFFEVPELLKQSNPKIFDILTAMLNQNPLHSENDYKVIVSSNE